MAAPERILAFLPRSSAAMASCPPILSIRSLHSKHEFGHHPHNQAPHHGAPAVGKDDDPLRLPPCSSAQPEGRSSVSSLILKAVQQGGANTVIQQVSSMKHLLIPELPYALINEIKKKMALSFFKEQDDELDDGGLMEDSGPPSLISPEGLEEEQGMGPRCAWPRPKALLSEVVLKQEQAHIQGPRCAWPRGVVLGSSIQLSQAQGTVVEGGAKCAWPRAKVGGCVHTGSPSLAFKGFLQEENEDEIVPSQGPRCAWPRGTVAKHAPLNKDLPRRMLATSVGLSLMNYLLVAQGAPSLACPGDLLLLQHPMGHEELLQSPNKRSLLVLH